jgi:predicted ArsR family transcriptional regulator
MSNMTTAIRQQLAATNGGPGLTADELAARLGATPAIMRNELARLVFAKDGGVTCIADGKRGAGRYKLGDSGPLRRVSA